MVKGVHGLWDLPGVPKPYVAFQPSGVQTEEGGREAARWGLWIHSNQMSRHIYMSAKQELGYASLIKGHQYSSFKARYTNWCTKD